MSVLKVETDIKTSITRAAILVIMYVAIFKTFVIAIISNVSMSSTSYWPIISSIRVSLLILTTRCCTLRRAKNTPTRSFVSRTVNRK